MLAMGATQYLLYVETLLSFRRFGEVVQTNGWSGHIIPTGSFTTDSYLWIQFITNGVDSDGRFHEGWTGNYQRYWPYVIGKKKRK